MIQFCHVLPPFPSSCPPIPSHPLPFAITSPHHLNISLPLSPSFFSTLQSSFHPFSLPLLFDSLLHFSPSILLKSRPDSVHVLITKWQTRDSFRLLKAKARCVQIYLSRSQPPFFITQTICVCVEGGGAWATLGFTLSKTTSNGAIHMKKKRPFCCLCVCLFINSISSDKILAACTLSSFSAVVRWQPFHLLIHVAKI